MAAQYQPAPHVNVFGVHTEYGPKHPQPPGPLRARLGTVVGSVAGLAAGAAGVAVALLRRK